MVQSQSPVERPAMPETLSGSPVPASAPHPMDGSQFHNVIEEQTWSDLPPTPEEQMPRRARHLDDAESDQAPHPEQAQISVGPA